MFVAFPLAGAASLLASVLIAAGLPWGTVNRYVFAIMAAPIIWGVLAMWAGMTETLARTALLLTGVIRGVRGAAVHPLIKHDFLGSTLLHNRQEIAGGPRLARPRRPAA